MTHAKAKLTPQGRLLLVSRVLQEGWSVPMAAEAQGCSPATGYKWLRRFRSEGHVGLRDRRANHTARPRACPTLGNRRSCSGAGIGWRSPPDRAGRSGRLPPCGAPGAPTPRRTQAGRHRPSDPVGGRLRTRAARRAHPRRHRRIRHVRWRWLAGLHGLDNRRGSRVKKGEGYDFVHAAVDRTFPPGLRRET